MLPDGEPTNHDEYDAIDIAEKLYSKLDDISIYIKKYV